MTSEEEAATRSLGSQGWSATTLHVWVRANGHCEYCDKDLQGTSDEYFFGYNIDHVVPASRGGSCDPFNYALACRACNFIKRNCDFRNGETGVTREVVIARARQHIAAERARNDVRMKEALPFLKACGLKRP